MKKRLLTAGLVACALMSLTAKNDQKSNDQVLMTIDNKPVYVSEFDYLYGKNNAQQSSPQSRSEYFELFKTYKLKVAEAEAARLDTLESFKNELDGYRHELAYPYFIDKDVENQLVEEAYSHMNHDRLVSHVMLPIESTPEFVDSIKSLLLNGGDMDALARNHSIDPAVRHTGGARMGWVMGNGLYPYSFEKATYDTPKGEFSEPVNSGFGIHIIRVDSMRPARGTVLVQHILKLTQGLDADAAAKKKAEIDSIYSVVKSGVDFSEVAMNESEDPGSARQGGQLDWFGPGQMVPEFEATAYATADGEISEPFATSYGWHIIKKLGHRGVPSLEESRKGILDKMAVDERSSVAYNARRDHLAAEYGMKLDENVLDATKKLIEDCGGYDSVAIKKLLADNTPLVTFKVPVAQVTVAQATAQMPTTAKVAAEYAIRSLRGVANSLAYKNIFDYYTDQLSFVEPDFRNLINEYHDGMLLFEISNREVWDKASKDTEGLQRYFEENRDQYKWDAPKYKGLIVFATSDSIAQKAEHYLATHDVATDSLVKTLRGEFGVKNIRVERVLAAKGENTVVDAVAFGGIHAANGKWSSYFGYQGRILDQPESAADVRGAVTSAYQAKLEKEWLERMHRNHKVKINKKGLKALNL